eukprot:12714714-Alexandrium_andersonii.AAC.1
MHSVVAKSLSASDPRIALFRLWCSCISLAVTLDTTMMAMVSDQPAASSSDLAQCPLPAHCQQ